jgi:arylsulfatase A-like enzyme
MKRREFMETAAKAAVATTCLGKAAVATTCLGMGQSLGCRRKTLRAATAERPNIVLLVADDLGWRDLGCYGDRQVSTPSIDGLAAEGVRFTNAFVAAPSCSPSRASIITGQHPHTNGVTGLTHRHKRLMLSPFKRTLAEVLDQWGYNTALEGKWHVAPYLPSGWYGYAERLSGILPKDFWIRSSDEAIAFIEENRSNAFYLELNYMDTHRDDYGEFHFVENFTVDPEEIAVPSYYALPDWPEIREEVAKYYSNASKMDMMIGEVLAKLEELDLVDSTLVCFVSDNGPPFPGNKMTLYDRGIGTPLVMRWPGRIPAGTVNGSLASAVDLMPTFLEAAGCPIPPEVQGRSVLPLARGDGGGPLHEEIFAEMTYHVHYLPMRAIRTTKWKYIRNYSDDAVGLDQCAHMEWAQRLCELPNQGWTRPRVPEELYDLEDDPNEQENLVDDPAFEAVLETMRGSLDRQMAETRDPYLGRRFERNFPAKGFSHSPGKAYP